MKMIYTTAEAAEVLGVSRKTIYRLIKAGKLRAKKMGYRTIRISHEAIMDYMGNDQTALICDTFGCNRRATKRLAVSHASGTDHTLTCPTHWALDYQGRVGSNVEVEDLGDHQTDTQEVSA